MKRLWLLLPALLLSSAALAQTAPDAAKKDLWCGTALGLAFGSPPEGTPAEEIARVKPYLDGGVMLVERASAAYKTAGFSDEQLAGIRADLEPVITEQINATADKADYSFEDCTALLPAPAQ